MFATLLAFLVILLGSYVRLSNAGLGCPDWPGCYGKLMVPQPQVVQVSHPDSEFHPHKAWKEMIHRYLAGSLALSILLLAFLALFQRREGRPVLLPLLLLALVVFQALLGMWTVTLKLHPLVVMGHLLGGYSTFILLLWLSYRTRERERGERAPLHYQGLPAWVAFGFLLLLLQIILGGWLSANYASLACPDFPTCQGRWWPEFHFSQAFTFWHEFGPNYEWGILNNTARVTIHMMHRLGAMAVFAYWLCLSLLLLSKPIYSDLRGNAWLVLICLLAQVGLGVSNILFLLPLGVAVAHTGMAALLLAAILCLWLRLHPLKRPVGIHIRP